ncbi:MAG: 3-deoxy-manno-octulosonate cytidylyltransferase [Legionellales bacterium]|nr:3-deoxy-manno-octulosonate cytidylyltransferase [Legionellales bacterium]
MSFHVIIPARYQSSRLPGKLLMDLKGQTVLERVYRQASQAHPKSVTIATDSELIFDVATAFGASVMMTSISHQSGTDRIAEVAALLGWTSREIIVNVQGDEPLIDPALISQVAASLAKTDAPMATLCSPVTDLETYMNPNRVKLVRDAHHRALYFSRSAIPARRDASMSLGSVFWHIGIYAYRAAFLQEIVTWPVCELERLEGLEQLRVLWAGHAIHVEEACVEPLQDINTVEDLRAVRQLLS